MATNTTNYGFKKPDESDFYDVADQNKNWDLADEALKNLDTPTFEDYTGSTAVPSATDAIDQIKSKGKLGTLLSNIKAAFKGACLIGHIVNNCVTDNAGLPLSAAQGKVLKDLYTQLYSDLDAVKAKQINRYVSAEKNTDTVLSSYENKEGNFILQFTSNDTTGTIPTLTGSHLLIIEHFMVGDNSDSAIERAYSTKGKLIAWRFKQWWNKTWTAWENS